MGITGQGGSLQFCPLLNETTCGVSQGRSNFYTVIYNSRARFVQKLVKIAVNSSTWTVWDNKGRVVNAQVVPSGSTIVPYTSPAPFYIYVLVSLPALGYSIYFFTQNSPQPAPFTPAQPLPIGNTLTVQNDNYQVSFGQNGLLSSFTDLHSKRTMQISQDWLFYSSFEQKDPSSNDRQNSGAYIFRPASTQASRCSGAATPTLSIVRGKIVTEVRQVFCDWIQQTVRIPSGNWSNSIEIAYEIGTIPVDRDGIGKEVITRFTTDLNNQQAWRTDSNGREFMERKLNYRATWNYIPYQEVAGNYAPVNAAMYMQDIQDGRLFAVMTDRSQGGGSLATGQMELMAHRRTLADDSRGVGEAMNETISIKPYPDASRIGEGIGIMGSYYLTFSDQTNGARLYREEMTRVFNEPLITLAPLSGSVSDFVSAFKTASSFSGISLPHNVELMTLQPWSNGQVLVRVAHQYAVNEDGKYSQQITFDLAKVFASPLIMDTCQEVSLTANEDAAAAHARRLERMRTYRHTKTDRPSDDRRGGPTVVTSPEYPGGRMSVQ
eukprot:g57629.t1